MWQSLAKRAPRPRRPILRLRTALLLTALIAIALAVIVREQAFRRNETALRAEITVLHGEIATLRNSNVERTRRTLRQPLVPLYPREGQRLEAFLYHIENSSFNLLRNWEISIWIEPEAIDDLRLDLQAPIALPPPGTSIAEALDAALAPLGLVYYITHRGYIVITTPTRAANSKDRIEHLIQAP